jgi:sugar phosphate isomerase/epimerase
LKSLSDAAGRNISRRDFVHQLGLASAGLVLGPETWAHSASATRIPVVVFSKAYQPLKLSFDQASELTAEAGLDGVDSPVRPDGEVLPERVADDLPAYVAALEKHGLRMPYVTTAITNVATPKAEQILRTAKSLGIKWYRLGFMFRADDAGWPRQLREIKAQLKDLVGMSRELGIGAVMQNHSPSGHVYVGGDLDELADIVEGFDRQQLGVAFDIAHALNVHGQNWRPRFEKLRPHLQVVYVKDCNKQKEFVPLGAGQVRSSGYFDLLKEIKYRQPISLHIEYSGSGQPERRPELLKAIQGSLELLRRWTA